MTAANQPRSPNHHPDDGVLMDYASGAAHEAGAVLIATHLAFCPQCHDTVRNLESLGGALIQDLPPSALTPGSRDAVLARLDEPSKRHPAAADGPEQPMPATTVPRPLRDYLGADLATLPWRRIGPAVQQVEVPVKSGGQEHMRLLRAKAGTVIPRHTHRGTEMILVLFGGYRDQSGQFLPGDFAFSDDHVDHTPRVDPGEDCLCLSVTDAPLRFTGPFGRILNLFVRL